jgi:hypothetical protein
MGCATQTDDGGVDSVERTLPRQVGGTELHRAR